MLRTTGLGLALAAGAVLAACSSEAPPPYERQAADVEAVEANRIVLRGEGIAAGAEAFYFSAGRSEVEAALTGALGEPVGRSENGECGAGPMQFTSYPGGLTINFQNDFFVGWLVDETSTNIAADGGVAVGTPKDEVASAPGFTMIEDSTLGEEFSLGDAIGGFMGEDAVSALYAGTNCFFR